MKVFSYNILAHFKVPINISESELTIIREGLNDFLKKSDKLIEESGSNRWALIDSELRPFAKLGQLRVEPLQNTLRLLRERCVFEVIKIEGRESLKRNRYFTNTLNFRSALALGFVSQYSPYMLQKYESRKGSSQSRRYSPITLKYMQELVSITKDLLGDNSISQNIHTPMEKF